MRDGPLTIVFSRNRRVVLILFLQADLGQATVRNSSQFYLSHSSLSTERSHRDTNLKPHPEPKWSQSPHGFIGADGHFAGKKRGCPHHSPQVLKTREKLKQRSRNYGIYWGLWGKLILVSIRPHRPRKLGAVGETQLAGNRVVDGSSLLEQRTPVPSVLAESKRREGKPRGLTLIIHRGAH
jgi:hypothetical protein